MDAVQKQVAIELQTTIIDNGEKENNKQKQVGSFRQKNELDVLIFEEKMDEGPIIKNIITMQANKVSINRSGAVKMNQKFLAKALTENIYQHPHGILHMETFTESIDYQRPVDGVGGQLTIIYTVKLNGQDERNHTLKLNFTEEEHQ